MNKRDIRASNPATPGGVVTRVDHQERDAYLRWRRAATELKDFQDEIGWPGHRSGLSGGQKDTWLRLHDVERRARAELDALRDPVD